MRQRRKKLRDRKDQDRMLRQVAGVCIAATACFVVLLFLFSAFLSSRNTIPSIDLLSTNPEFTVIRSDGSVEHYDKNYFKELECGDTLTISIDPLGEDSTILDNAALVFSLYHCRVKVYVGDELIYTQTEPDASSEIGHRYYMIPLPDDYENHTIRIVATDSEHDRLSVIDKLRIVPDVYAVYSFSSGTTAETVLMLTLLTLSFFVMLLALNRWITGHRQPGMISMSGFCFSLVLWYMGYMELLVPIIQDWEFLANIEYVALYFTPIPLSIFIQSEIKSYPILRNICRAMSAAFTIFFAVITYVSFHVSGTSYVDFIQYLRLLLLIALIFFGIAQVLEGRKERGSRDFHVVAFGYLTATILGGLELVRYVLSQQYGHLFPFLHFSLMPFVILTLTMTLLFRFGLSYSREYVTKIQEENLKVMAFTDPLTMAPNRAKCREVIQRMKEQNITDYVMIFVDINYLKRTNDTFGHEMGDELIKTTGELLRKHFSGGDFYGRLGGDEFIAIHFGTKEEAGALMQQVSEDIREVNKSGKFAFTMSESWGISVSTLEHPLSPELALHEADKNMYEAKKAAHAGR